MVRSERAKERSRGDSLTGGRRSVHRMARCASRLKAEAAQGPGRSSGRHPSQTTVARQRLRIVMVHPSGVAPNARRPRLSADPRVNDDATKLRGCENARLRRANPRFPVGPTQEAHQSDGYIVLVVGPRSSARPTRGPVTTFQPWRCRRKYSSSVWVELSWGQVTRPSSISLRMTEASCLPSSTPH